MSKSIYLISPKAEFPNYYSGESFDLSGYEPAVFVADLAAITVAAFVPDDFHVEVCEENITPVNLDHPADFIGLTGKSTQVYSMIKLSKEFRKRGKTVIIGGPYASLDPESVRPYCDILVEGEMEDIAEDFFNDLRNGTWKDHYKGTRPDLSTSPIPRWDLYPNDRTQVAAVQTSRGCPFECEFCDVIQYLGRKQRHKKPDQVIAELDVLYKLGHRAVFLADDNFTVYRRRAKELLKALKEWNTRQVNGHVIFITQLSVDAALDKDLLRMCAEAGLNGAFIGIETPNEESLKESKKVQNLDYAGGGGTLLEKLENFITHGIVLVGGMIVGFDNDDHRIFDIQFKFAQQTPIPNFALVALRAPISTPLYDRIQKEGRLVKLGAAGEMTEDVWLSNIIPKQMTREELIMGIQWLANNLYTPKYFGVRLKNLLNLYGTALDSIPYANTKRQSVTRSVVMDSVKLTRQFARLGPEETQLWMEIGEVVKEKPWTSTVVAGVLTQYMQVRKMYEDRNFWNPSLVDIPPDLKEISSVLASSS